MGKMSKKQRRKTSYKAHYKLFLVLLMVNLMAIPLISALDFDNVGFFDSKIGNYGEYTIVNAFGLGDDIAKLKLNTNTEVCSNNCRANKTITLYKNDTVLISDVRFDKLIDGDWEESSIRRYSIKYYGDVDTREYICNVIGKQGNGSDILDCVNTVTGTHKSWINYNLGEELPAGTYEVLLEGVKSPNAMIDWKIESNGVWTDEWATWGNISGGDDAEVILNSPEDNFESAFLDVEFNCSANITGGSGLINVSLFHNVTGAFARNQTEVVGTGLATLRDFFDDSDTAADADDTDWEAQTFTAQSTYIPSNVSIKISSDESPGICIIGIRAVNDADRKPTGADLTNGTRDCQGISTTVWFNITMDTDFELQQNTNYSVVVRMNDTNRILWEMDETSPNFPNGTGARSTDSGGTWAINANRDHTFRIYSGGTNFQTSTFNSTINSTTLWSCEACDTDGACGFAPANRTVSLDVLPPSVVIEYPIGQVDSHAFGDEIDINWTITDSNLAECWFEYNGSNNTLTCGDMNDTFIPVVGEQSLRLYANDTTGLQSFNDTSWTYGFLETNVTFNRNTFETSSQDFELNLTTDIDVLTIDSFLFYNGVNDRSTATCTDDGNCTLTNTIDLPLVSQSNETENKTFLWDITIFNGTDSIDINTTIRQQNVTKIHLEVCNATYPTVALNFTAFDEQNLTAIDPFIFSGDFETWLGDGGVKRPSNISSASVSSRGLCLFPNGTHFIDGQVTYDHPTQGAYTQRNYWFQNDTISNVTQDIPLALLIAGDSTSFILKVQDTDILPVPDVIIFTERFYPGEGEFRIVQVAKTDDNGGTVGFFEAETADYRFILKQQAETVLTTNDQKVVGESTPFTLTFTIGDVQATSWEGFEDDNNLTQSLTFNSSSNIVTFVYSDISGEFISGNLLVQRLMSNGSANINICNSTSFQSSATLFCDLTGNESGTYTGRGLITRTSESSTVQILVQILFGTTDFTAVGGNYGLFLGWFVILLSCFAFKFNEIAGIFMINVAVIGVNIIGLIHFGVVFISSMIALSIFIAVILER